MSDIQGPNKEQNILRFDLNETVLSEEIYDQSKDRTIIRISIELSQQREAFQALLDEI